MNHLFSPRLPDPTLAAFDSPIGHLTLAARGGALVGVWARGQRFFGCPVGIDEAVVGSLEPASPQVASSDGTERVTQEDAATASSTPTGHPKKRCPRAQTPTSAPPRAASVRCPMGES